MFGTEASDWSPRTKAFATLYIVSLTISSGIMLAFVLSVIVFFAAGWRAHIPVWPYFPLAVVVMAAAKIAAGKSLRRDRRE